VKLVKPLETARASAQSLRETVDSWLHGLLKHMAAARAADERVQRRLGQVRVLYQNLTEEQLRAKVKVDYDLNDALSEYRQHCSEVQRYSNAIQALAAGHELLTELSER
jgi:hypothetical protein